MNQLASALADAMRTSARDLVIFDRETNEWRRHPWSAVQALAEKYATWILDNDRPGAVGLIGDPTVEFIAAMQGTWLAGAPLSILSGPVRGADVQQWSDSTLGRFSSIGVRTVLGNGEPLAHLSANPHPDVQVHDLSVPNAAKEPTHFDPPDTDAPAVLQGTAGSTGVARTAVLSPAAVLANVAGVNQRMQVDGSVDVGCSWLPVYHDMGLAFILANALSGMELWLAPTAAFTASPFRWLTWLTDSQATFTVAPNFAYNLIGKYASRVSDADLGSLRCAMSGGEPVDCEGFSRFADAMAPFGFDANAATPAYGLAESSCAVTVPQPRAGLQVDVMQTDSGPRRRAVLGEPISGTEIRIVPNGDHPETAGPTVGEIQIRGESMMDGYLGEDPIGHGQWFGTGDLGYLTDAGLVVCGRIKELISIAGRNIFPTEVEEVAAQVPGVREGAVVVVGTDPDATNPGLVVAAEFRGRDESGARSEVMRRVASFCGVVPSDVVFMTPGSLPRTSSGKLRRLDVKRSLGVGTTA